jgi:hypothetical protein
MNTDAVDTDLIVMPFSASVVAVAGGNLHGREFNTAEGRTMKTIRAIVAGLGAMMILSVVMIFVTMPRAIQPNNKQTSHAAIHPPCKCTDQCLRMRKAGL